MPAFNPEASARWFSHLVKNMSPSSPGAEILTPDVISKIEAMREEIRAEEGGGGMCHAVAEALQFRYGWERLFVSYLDEEGEIICGGGHVVSILPDGSVFDPTRDQFGEGHSVSLIRPWQEEIGRYRPEFYEDYHPRHPDAVEMLEGWADAFDGTMDAEKEDENVRDRGLHWWLEDKADLEAYAGKQAAYGFRVRL